MKTIDLEEFLKIAEETKNHVLHRAILGEMWEEISHHTERLLEAAKNDEAKRILLGDWETFQTNPTDEEFAQAKEYLKNLGYEITD